MAKKDKKTKPQAPPVNPEITAAEKTYKREVRITETAPKIRTAIYLVWSVFDLILLTIFIVYLGFYLTVASFNERRHVARIGENIDTHNAITEANAAVPLLASEAIAIALGDGTYDFYGEVENVNEEWYATFDYYFQQGDESTEVMRGFALPSDERPVVTFRTFFDNRPTRPELVIENVTWERIDHHQIPDITAWLEEHKDFQFSDVTFGLTSQVGEEAFSESRFVVENATPYAYYDAEFLLLVRQGNVLAGVRSITIPNLDPGDVRTMTVRWFQGAPTSGTMTVIPNIDFFDEQVYAPPPTELFPDTRDRF